MVVYTDDPLESAKVTEALEILERLGMLNKYCAVDGTPYKEGDLYKEIVEENGPQIKT